MNGGCAAGFDPRRVEEASLVRPHAAIEKAFAGDLGTLGGLYLELPRSVARDCVEPEKETIANVEDDLHLWRPDQMVRTQ